MANVQNPIKKLLNLKNGQARFDKIRQKFADKTFTEEHGRLNTLLQWSRWLLACFSIMSGFGYLFNHVGFINYIIGFLVSIIALVLIEVLKNLLIGSALVYYFKYGVNMMFIPAIILLVASVYLSLSGIEILHKEMDTSIVDMKESYVSQRDSIEQHYDNALLDTENKLAAFKAQVSWKGRINVYDATIKQTLGRYNNELNDLYKDKQQELINFKVAHDINLDKAKNNFSFRGEFWLAITVIVEMGIMICLWFNSYYEYNQYKEGTVFEEVETYEMNLEQIRTVARMVSANSTQLLLGSNSKFATARLSGSNKNADRSKEIGFKRSSNPEEHERTDISKEQEYLIKYADVVDKIEQGLNEKTILKLCNIKRTTYYNVKRILNNQTVQ